MRGLALMVCLYAIVCTEVSAQTNSLGSLRAACESDRMATAVTAQVAKQNALKKYSKSLDGLMTALKKKGDLDTYVVVESEKKRFASEGNVPDAENADPSFISSVEAYYREIGTAETATRQQQAAALLKYVSALEAYIKKSMQADRVDDAKRAKEDLVKTKSDLVELQSQLPESSMEKLAVKAKPAAPVRIKVDCAMCDGSTKVSKECSKCSETSRCPDCNGQGYTYGTPVKVGGLAGPKPVPGGRVGYSRYRYYGSYSDYHKCSTCKGNGVCPYCKNGRKDALCTQCKGTGKVTAL